jgi:hypothetical protein
VPFLTHRVSTRPPTIGLERRPQRADRHPLGWGRCRTRTQIRGGIDRAGTGYHPGGRFAERDGVAARYPKLADRVRRVVDPVGTGFVDALARPGGNTTGFMLFEYSMSVKWLELLKQIAPGTTRVAILRNPANPASIAEFVAIRSAGQPLPGLRMAA